MRTKARLQMASTLSAIGEPLPAFRGGAALAVLAQQSVEVLRAQEEVPGPVNTPRQRPTLDAPEQAARRYPAMQADAVPARELPRHREDTLLVRLEHSLVPVD